MATKQAVVNDERIKQGLPVVEKVNDEKVLVWPDLVYTELICMVGVSALLLVWALFLPAPLEEPASSVKTPNPSKGTVVFPWPPRDVGVFRSLVCRSCFAEPCCFWLDGDALSRLQ